MPGFLCLMDTQVCQAPHVTWGFLRFLPAGQLSEGLLFYHSGKPKYNRCKGQFQQNIGIGAPWNWLQRQLAKQACGSAVRPTSGYHSPTPNIYTFMCSAPDLAPEVLASTWGDLSVPARPFSMSPHSS